MAEVNIIFYKTSSPSTLKVRSDIEVIEQILRAKRIQYESVRIPYTRIAIMIDGDHGISSCSATRPFAVPRCTHSQPAFSSSTDASIHSLRQQVHICRRLTSTWSPSGGRR